MHIGIVLNLTDQTPSIRDCAPVLEERGFESLWLGEHTHMPTDSVYRYSTGKWATAGRKTREGYLPEFYKRMPDPYVQLTAAAMLTSNIKLGTCIALPAEHNPIVLAKEIATLDSLSGGRFLFGVGYGWNPLEMAHNGFAYEDRREVLREKIGAMQAIWTEPTASYDGNFVRFSESWSWPKPAGGSPPVYLGAAPTTRNLDDVVRWADGWIPVRAFMGDRMAENLADLRARATKAGRDPATIAISVVDPEGAQGGKRSRDEFEARMVTEEALATYEELGVERVILGLPTTDFDFFRWAADKTAQLNERISS